VSDPSDVSALPFLRFGLIVTGKGEEQFLPSLFRHLMATGRCTFEIIRRIGQRSPITSPKRQLTMIRTGKILTDKDEEEIGLPARRYLTQRPNSFVLLVDDLEVDRVTQQVEVFQRYREVFDRMLGSLRHRASIHFLINMLEGYFFADTRAVNAVLGTDLQDCIEDPETIRHPKNDLKTLFRGYDEIEHGRRILAQLDLPLVLSRADTCASLRTMIAWCSKALGESPTDVYQLLQGRYNPVTRPQLDALQILTL
jgi:hypothetical protein